MLNMQGSHQVGWIGPPTHLLYPIRDHEFWPHHGIHTIFCSAEIFNDVISSNGTADRVSEGKSRNFCGLFHISVPKSLME